MKYLAYLLFVTVPLVVKSQNKSPCSGAIYDVVKPYLGEWKEYRITDSSQVYLGILTTKLQAGGCAITQKFVSVDSSFQYLSHGFVNQSSNIWEETYVFSTGGISKFQWIKQGDKLYTRRTSGSKQTDYQYRLQYMNTTDLQYEVIPQKSFDGGSTWQNDGLTRIIKIQ